MKIREKIDLFFVFILVLSAFFLLTGFAGAATNLSNSPGSWSTCPRITVDPIGNIHVIWVEEYGDTSGDVFYRKYDFYAKTWSAPLNLSNSYQVRSVDNRPAGIASDSSGNIYVSYSENINKKIKLRICSNGNWNAPIDVATTNGECDSVRVAVDPSGNIFLTWWDTTQFVCYSRAWVGGWESVKAISGGSSKLPDIAVGNNVVFACWTGRNPQGVYDIYYVYRSKAFNAGWSTPQLVNPLPAGIEKQQAPAVEIDGNDVAHIIWTPVFLNSGGVRQVRHAYWTGNGFSAPQHISGQYLLHYPAIHERGNNIYCVWQMGGYEAGSSIDYNNRIFGSWQGQQSVPSSSGSTYSDVATSPYQDEVYYLWDANGDIWIHIKQVFTMGLLPVLDGSDYNNDGLSDLTVWRPTNGYWYLKDIGQYGFGQLGDIPAPGDYNGDGATDSAVWRPTNGYWYIRNIGNFQYGKSGDIPVPGDYNGDNVTDMAVYRSSNGTWYINNVGVFQWGTLGDYPVPGDYDGDNVTELAVWRPTNGVWYIKDVGSYQWGSANDVPVPADYNGDGTTDVAVWRPANGVWYLRNIGVYQWGVDGDIPVPGKYDSAAGADIAVWRPANGVWYIRNIATHFWGMAGDYPLVR